ncbi:MAG: MlaD family protein [Desulfobacterales bacterium]
METKAPYVVIGIFTLVVVGAIMAFVQWALSHQLPASRIQTYTIDFSGSVAGLNPTGEVFFNGIKVGRVSDIAFLPEDPRKVRVQVKIAADTPVHSDALAALEYQGITGVSVIQITGGRPGSPPLEAQPGQPWPQIPSRESELRQVLQQAPELLQEATRFIQGARQVLSEENLSALTQILDHLEQFSGTLASQKEAIPQIVDQLARMAQDLAAAAQGLERIAARSAGVVEQADATLSEARRTLARAGTLIDEDLRQATQGIFRLAGDIDQFIQTAGPGFTRFSSEGLLSLSQLIQEARLLLASVDRVVQRLESAPERFVFGNPVPEVQLP